MTFAEVLTAISTIGFPIVACCAIAYFFAKVNNNYRNDIKEINAEHKKEIDAMTTAINNNTMVLQKLVDRMDGDTK